MQEIIKIRKISEKESVLDVLKCIKSIRLEIGMNIVDFADACGITAKSYTTLEKKGTGTAFTILKILQKLSEWGFDTNLTLGLEKEQNKKLTALLKEENLKNKRNRKEKAKERLLLQ